jgi:outer membrane usher protein
MSSRRTSHGTVSAFRPVVCRQILLCAGIAAALATWSTGVTAASAASASGVPATGADVADAGPADSTFDRSLLPGAGENTASLARFEHANPVPAGNYNADVYLNNTWVGRSNIRFVAPSDRSAASACIDRKLLDQLGLHPDKLSAQTIEQWQDPNGCVSIGSLIPSATTTFDLSNLRLDVSVPQAYLKQMARGYVSPQYWDEGVTAGLLNYNFNSYHISTQGQSLTTAYLGLNAGFNLGLWHFREDSTLNWQSGSGATPAQMRFQKIDTYVERDLPSLRAQLTIGDSYTDGQVFDSYGLRGVQIATDDRMLPQSLQGYAPVVHGVAATNALVTIRQNGVQIYQATVAPGPFEIKDLYPTGYGGTLDVTVTEADGRVTTFSVPYASVVQLLRPGITRFDIALGQLRDLSLAHEPSVVQATFQHGFNNLLTGYAGVVGSQGYAAALIGSAINTHYGAVALDVTQARAQILGYATQSGESMRLSYSKIFTDTNTSISVAAYRYSTSGYFSLTDTAQARDDVRRDINQFNYVAPVSVSSDDSGAALLAAQQANLYGNVDGSSVISSTGLERQRSTFSITLSQQLGKQGGSLYANTSTTDYWNKAGNDNQFQVGYSNSIHRISYSISATRTRDLFGSNDNQLLLNFSIPLGDTAHAPNLSVNLTHDKDNGTQEQTMLNGTAGVDNAFSYGATATHASDGAGSSESVNGGYRSPYAVINASYGSGSGYSQDSLNITGGVVAHAGGITFGQPISDTVGLVYAPGADGARVASAAGARIGGSGYALVPYLTPYILNTVQIDPKGLPLDVQLDATSAQVAPHEGAVVLLKFKTETGRTVILRVRLADGQAVPFGAEVFNEKNISLGVVGQAGKLLVRGVDQQGLLHARWQDDNDNAQSCSFSYHLTPAVKGKHAKRYEEIDATCNNADGMARVAGGNP